MVPVLASYLEETSPKFNDFALHGMAVNDIPKIEHLVDAELMKLNNPNGLSYEGYTSVRPEEEIEALKKSTRKVVDINITDFWPISMKFKYKTGGQFERRLQLPYVDRGGITRVNGTRYGINPVLSHNVISQAKDGIFVKLSAIKMLVKRKPINVLINGEVMETEIVCSDGIFKKTKTTYDVSFIVTLAARYGWNHMLAMCNIDKSKVIIKDVLTADMRETHHEFATVGLKPKGVSDYGYIPSTTHIYVCKEYYKVAKHQLDRVIGGLINLLDHFPIQGKGLTEVIGDKVVEESYWILMLTLMFYKGKTGETGFTAVKEMLSDIDPYLDVKNRERLVYDNIYASNFYELLVRMVMDITEMRAGVESRYLDILTYLPYKVYEGINKLRMLDRNNLKPVTQSLMMKATTTNINHRSILAGFKSSKINLTITPVSNPTDNLFLGITSITELQDFGRGNDRDNGAKLKEGAKIVNALDIRQGNLHLLKKKKYIPTASLNPMANFSEEGRLILTVEEQLETRYLNHLLDGRMELKEGESIETCDTDIDLD